MTDRIIYAPNDPKKTSYIQRLRIIAGIIPVDTQYYVTATHWGYIIDELNAQYRDTLMDPTRPAPWDLHPNNPMKFGLKSPFLTVVNSGTEDQSVCDLLNDEPARVAEFGARQEKLRSA